MFLMSNLLGLNKTSFIIKFDTNTFNRKNILMTPGGTKVKVIKVYKYNLYRRILHFFGFQFKLFNCVKVKQLKNE